MKKNGFTLVEIIIALGIIALFVSVPVISFAGYTRSQRDIKRKNDIGQIQSALYQYKATKGTYPTSLNNLVTEGYMAKPPVDPQDGKAIGTTGLTYKYEYSAIGNGTSYTLSAALEDSKAPAGSIGYYISTPQGISTSTQTGSLPSPTSLPTSTPVPSNTPFVIPTATPIPGNSWRAMGASGWTFGRIYPHQLRGGNTILVWGGINVTNPTSCDVNQECNDGKKYSISSDTWSSVSATNAPVARSEAATVWTGTEFIIWGGTSSSCTGGACADGKKYNPSTDTWTTMSTTNAPTSKFSPTAVWTGSEVIIWGGDSSTTTVYHYNPTSNTWTNFSPTLPILPRRRHKALWTGTEMLVWGGQRNSADLGDGAKYNPTTHTWTVMPASGLLGRQFFSAVWTGTEMIIWGGTSNSCMNGICTDGKRYNPSTNTWAAQPLPTTNAPSERGRFSYEWTGTEMIIWGGYATNPNATCSGTFTTCIDGKKYNPSTNTWTNMANGPISGRSTVVATWTGTDMFVFGGEGDDPRCTGVSGKMCREYYLYRP